LDKLQEGIVNQALGLFKTTIFFSKVRKITLHLSQETRTKDIWNIIFKSKIH